MIHNNLMAVRCFLVLLLLNIANGLASPPTDQLHGAKLARDPRLVNGRIEIGIHDVEYLLMPAADEIEEMSIELYNNPFGYPDVPRFKIPKEDFVTVLTTFETPMIRDDVYLDLREMGCIRIRKIDGRVEHIPWFWSGKGALTFSRNGMRCTRERDLKPLAEGERAFDENQILDGKVRKIYERITGHIVRKIVNVDE